MNAIILAAGLGSRFKEITKVHHKSLLEIGGKPNLERTLDYLKEFGIEEIYIVVGYLKEQFEYLKDKYNVKLIENEHYSDYNNIYSFYLASEYFSDSLIIEGDIVLFDNIFKNLNISSYYVTTRKQNSVEWNPIVNSEGFVEKMEVSDKKIPSLMGISYWDDASCKIIKEYMKEKYLSKEILENSKLYWDNIVIDLFDKLKIKLNEIDNNLIFEMDNKEDYEYISKYFDTLKNAPIF